MEGKQMTVLDTELNLEGCKAAILNRARERSALEPMATKILSLHPGGIPESEQRIASGVSRALGCFSWISVKTIGKRGTYRALKVSGCNLDTDLADMLFSALTYRIKTLADEERDPDAMTRTLSIYAREQLEAADVDPASREATAKAQQAAKTYALTQLPGDPPPQGQDS